MTICNQIGSVSSLSSLNLDNSGKRKETHNVTNATTSFGLEIAEVLVQRKYKYNGTEFNKDDL